MLIWVEAVFYLTIGVIFVDAQRDKIESDNGGFILTVAFLLWPMFVMLKLLYKFFDWL